RELTSDLPVDAVLGTDIGKPPVAAAAGSLPMPPGSGGPSAPSRGPIFIPFLPIALFWLVVAGAAHATGLVVPVVIFLLGCLLLAGCDHPDLARGADRREGQGEPDGRRLGRAAHGDHGPVVVQGGHPGEQRGHVPLRAYPEQQDVE